MMTVDMIMAQLDQNKNPMLVREQVLAAEVRRLRDEINGLTGSLERAEAALKDAKEQEPIKYLYRVIDCFGHDVLRDDPKGATILETIPLYARPVPANLMESHQIKRDSNSLEFEGIKNVPAVAVPVVPFSDDDMAEIHQLAYELGGTDGGEYSLDGEQLEQVIVKAASLFYKPSVAVPEWFLSKLREILFASVVPEIPPHLVSNLPESWDEDFRNMYLRRLREECAANTRLGVILRARDLLQSAPQPTNGDAK